jgi:hypothetical protein
MLFNHSSWLRRKSVWGILALAMFASVGVPAASAAAADQEFNIQVAPSPLTITVKPGQTQTATLTVRNFSNHSETLYPRLNGFKIDKSSQKIELEEQVPLGLDQWISFKDSALTIPAGGTQPLVITYKTPQDVGFSYALAITLSRGQDQLPKDGTRLQGAVAVFNLINVDRKDAKRELTIEKFTADKSRYEFLPAGFTLTIKNSGNVIDQPQGNVFIQRSFDSSKPIATLPVNRAAGYILPDTSRTFTNDWKNGFPSYAPTQENGKTTYNLKWDWKHVGDLRFGKYVAKAVVVYNDGQRDVPLVASTTFWVIPWRIIFVTLVILLILGAGIYAWLRLIVKGTKKVKGYANTRR